MKNKGTIILCVFATLLTASLILFAVQLADYRSSVSDLGLRLDDYMNPTDLRFKSLEDGVQKLAYRDDGRIPEVLEELGLLNSKSDSLASQISGMKKTYDALYEEQKKKTLDTTSQDTAIAQIKKDAEAYFSQKNYAAAYREFIKVLDYQKDDMDSLLKKMKSLYYRNRADSSKYTEILEDIRILKANGHCDKEAIEIERTILAEREGLND